MTNKMVKSLPILSTIMLIIFTVSADQKQNNKLSARDAVTISIREIQETRNFVNRIPQLKTVQLSTHHTPELLRCVEGLISDLSLIKPTLHRIRHLKLFHLMSDADSLKPMMAHATELGKRCRRSLDNHVDGLVLSMLTRKLDDLSETIDNVVDRVSVVVREVYGY